MIKKLVGPIGMSLDRSPGKIIKWKSFFEILGVDCVISSLSPEKAAKKAEEVFPYAMNYCFFRKTCLGQYIDLVEKDIRTIFIPVKIKDGYLVCNSTRFMATEIAEFYKDKVQVINANIYTSGKKLEEIERIARLFSDDEEKIAEALALWNIEEESRKNNFAKKISDETRPTIMVIGKINHLFDYTDKDSPCMKYLVDKLCVNLIEPENEPHSNLLLFKKAYSIVHESRLALDKNRKAYWPEELIVSSIISNQSNIDGIMFVRDCFCSAASEEINLLQSIVKDLKIPSLIINYNIEAQSSVETAMETFVEMLEWRK